jgi:AAA domain
LDQMIASGTPYRANRALTALKKLMAWALDRGMIDVNAIAGLKAPATEQKWPLSEERPDGNRVLLLSAEDNWPRVTLSRLIKAGAVLDNIHVMHQFRALTVERLEKLAQEMEEWRPDLVIIDTLAAYMGAERDMHRQNEVGEFFGDADGDG